MDRHSLNRGSRGPGRAERIIIDDPSGVSRARRRAEELARHAEIPSQRVGEWAIAVTEAGTNLVRHAKGGGLVLGSAPGVVEMWALDEGPGIRDVGWALRDGSTTHVGSAGLGLGAIRRICDVADLCSSEGEGTVLYAGIGASPDVCGLALPQDGYEVSGDTFSFRREGALISALTFDGLGHGQPAFEAAQRAHSAFQDTPISVDPETALSEIDGALKGGRGGVGTVIRVTPEGIVASGVGNIDARLVALDGREQRLAPRPGTLGSNLPRLVQLRGDLEHPALGVMTSDGFTVRWSSKRYQMLLQRPVGLFVGVLLLHARRGRDDAGVLVFRIVPEEP